MYKFNYEYLSACVPFITCTVPGNWLLLNLPLIGGNIAYDTNEPAPVSVDSIFPSDHVFNSRRIDSEYVFQFSEADESHDSIRLISLVIMKKCGAVEQPTHEKFIGPINIRCRRLHQYQVNEDWDVPVVLLNHLLCGIAGSIPVGMSWIDFNDVFGFLNTHGELQFEFEGGDNYGEICSHFLRHVGGEELKASFPVFYISNMIRLEDLSALFMLLEAKEESTLTYAPCVKGENKKFASWLYQ